VCPIVAAYKIRGGGPGNGDMRRSNPKFPSTRRETGNARRTGHVSCAKLHSIHCRSGGIVLDMIIGREIQPLAVACPTCGAQPKRKWELSAGGLRNNPHRERVLAARDKPRRRKHGRNSCKPDRQPDRIQANFNCSVLTAHRSPSLSSTVFRICESVASAFS
jgi:hypothetical protein